MMAVAALVVTPAAGMAATAPKKAPAPVVAPALSQFDQGYAADSRGDYATALRFWRPLADQGNAGAQYNLGNMYDKGQGVPQDYAAAVSWYRKAADQGFAAAQYNLGNMYRLGQGVPQDYAAAVSWTRKAADQGDADAQGNLGVMYQYGQGVPQDYVQAHKWYNLGSARATEADDRDRNAKNRDAVAALMTPAQIAEAQRLASAWKATQ